MYYDCGICIILSDCLQTVWITLFISIVLIFEPIKIVSSSGYLTQQFIIVCRKSNAVLLAKLHVKATLSMPLSTLKLGHSINKVYLLKT